MVNIALSTDFIPLVHTEATEVDLMQRPRPHFSLNVHRDKIKAILAEPYDSPVSLDKRTPADKAYEVMVARCDRQGADRK